LVKENKKQKEVKFIVDDDDDDDALRFSIGSNIVGAIYKESILYTLKIYTQTYFLNILLLLYMKKLLLLLQ
jgi:hypothetical protein